ncbi:2,5-diketo-D-gluconic acid reductase [Helicobacter sp. NHP19-003]|uniref:2,5-diketo-D-gluconic acid reductase n=1 Tax=Helicobacter gastrocanis TaxID=2849641 RepID=A0ABM7SBT9_9HELI|nr:aldo/keto reductase [Helicobacter sp. NHP19-003]BCZ18128.1 2,5-diketo-D-gluconic acid reductase [Helicobacter sp. NHP19-003]
MEFVALNHQVKMPLLGLGVFQIPDTECEKVVLEAIAKGYRLIDTAQMYGNEAGVGRAVNKTSVPREELFITTKVWFSNAGEQRARASVEKSLQKMGLDYLDLVLVHQPFNDYYGTYRALEAMHQEGKIRTIGVSNFYPDRLADMLAFHQIPPVVNQIEMHPFFQRQHDLEFMQEHKVQPQAWSPFAEGQKDIFNHPVLQKIAHKHHKSPAQVILRWITQKGVVALFKSAKIERITENAQIFDFHLDTEDFAQIATMDTRQSVFLDHRTPQGLEYLRTIPFNA